MKYSLHEILLQVGTLANRQDKINYLQKCNKQCSQLKQMFDYLYNPNYIALWRVSKNITYKPNRSIGIENYLWSQVRSFYVFYEGGHANLTQEKCDKLFVQFLESLDSNEALLFHKFNYTKSMNYKDVDIELILETFPELIGQFKSNVIEDETTKQSSEANTEIDKIVKKIETKQTKDVPQIDKTKNIAAALKNTKSYTTKI